MPVPSSAPVLVFDVNETLLDLTVLEPFFQRVFGSPSVMRQWFAELILYSQAVTLSGAYVPFSTLSVGILRMLARIHGVEAGEGDLEEFTGLLRALPAHLDAADALKRLHSAGFRMVTLTNSAPVPGPTPLERAGLATFFERSFSVDSVHRFKPAPETYRLVADVLHVPLNQLCLVAAHTWDTLGAQSAGCLAALVARPGNAVLEAPGLPQPELVSPDLTTLADAVLARWG